MNSKKRLFKHLFHSALSLSAGAFIISIPVGIYVGIENASDVHRICRRAGALSISFANIMEEASYFGYLGGDRSSMGSGYEILPLTKPQAPDTQESKNNLYSLSLYKRLPPLFIRYSCELQFNEGRMISGHYGIFF